MFPDTFRGGPKTPEVPVAQRLRLVPIFREPVVSIAAPNMGITHSADMNDICTTVDPVYEPKYQVAKLGLYTDNLRVRALAGGCFSFQYLENIPPRCDFPLFAACLSVFTPLGYFQRRHTFSCSYSQSGQIGVSALLCAVSFTRRDAILLLAAAVFLRAALCDEFRATYAIL